MSVANTLLSAVPGSPSAGIRLLARLGFAAIGVVYLLMGALALMVATGLRLAAQADKEEAVQHLQTVPGGRLLLGLIAVGLLGYIVWRFTQAIRDTEGKGSDAKGVGTRLWYVCSGLFYSGLALYAGRLALQGYADKGGSTSQSLTAKVLAWPGGNWLVLLAGVVIIGVGLYQGYRAFSGQLRNDVDGSSLTSAQQRLVYRAAQIGITARGAVVAIIGYFVVQAGRQSRAGAVGSTDEAFDLLAAMGPLALGVVALGFVAYGLYSLVQAKYPILRGL
ncbi:DUF1206 domain-containing protein [Hymenobacter properus]|uniref:DUF1206 domain-containing protein n=1 Tax=Hymenobacter properus TaxID=2791026 RepID=A0A931BJF6_9BACT|nr:DUF1206 domain-containing protein [Hymenobacter properus]MBF9141333.1 DUF1206 domain-containing protein [Hymenobacter properus]MBR7720143.1 DUF1206 domain-containing protein [Microvirga sp. SRT04]